MTKGKYQRSKLVPMNESQQTLVRYLLGEMSDPEQTELEENYFADPRLFDQLVEAENQLVDQHARGQLAPEQQQHYQQPIGREAGPFRTLPQASPTLCVCFLYGS